MTDTTITDGVRIAELLSSELTGLKTGALSETAVVDAVSDVSPTAEGVEAYRIAHEDESIASVIVYPDHIEISRENSGDPDNSRESRSWDTSDLATVPADAETGITIDTATGDMRIERGAAVKSAIDIIRATVESETES